MSPLELLLVALGAAVGAPLRFVASHYLDQSRWPWGTLLVNLVGSLLLGVFSALALQGASLALLGTGLCGGMTTWSSFAVQTHRLGVGRGSIYAALSLGAALLACALGFVLTA